MFSIRPCRFSKFHLIILVCILTLVGCQVESEQKTKLEQIKERGTLRVSTLNNQLSYYIGSTGPTGLDYELAQGFAKKLGVRLEMSPSYSYSSLFPTLDNGNADIVAANMTITPQRLTHYQPGPIYYYVSPIVVYKKGKKRLRNIDDLIAAGDKLTVLKGSSFESILVKLKETHPNYTWQTHDNTDNNELLKQVAAGTIDYTITDSIELSLTQRIYPELAVSFSLSEEQPVSWFTKKSDEDSLQALLIEFFGELKSTGKLSSLEEKYFSHIESFDYVDTRAFIRALNNTLPRWEPLFKKHSGNFDWRLLAAISYQESHWEPTATSPTGVRGLMMLTLATADYVGIEDRLNPEQSIEGGATYLEQLMKRIPDSIDKHEKIWFALASYNLGFGHMMDARRLTKRLGGNPNLWRDVRQNLPKLREQKYFKDLRYGFARGDEGKKYVENIRRYYQSIIGYQRAKIMKMPQEEVTIEDLTIIEGNMPSEEPLTNNLNQK